MRALEFITGHVIFKLYYNQIYQLKTTQGSKQIQMRLDKGFGSIMELLKDVLEEERRDSSCSNGCTTKMLTWLFVGHGLSVIGACPCPQNHMQYLS